MREHLSKIVIVAALLVVVGLPFVLRMGWASDTAVVSDGPGTARLIIYTPHNEQIRHEMARGFNRHRADMGLAPVAFDWRASGGTSDLRKQILSQYDALISGAESAEEAQRRIEERGIGADLFFGGGEYEHNKLAKGVELQTGEGDSTWLAVTRPIELPPGLLDTVFPQPRIGGERLHHDELRWVGTTLSSFGIVYNTDALAAVGADVPRTWADLADPQLQGWVALADPGHSGSIAVTYNTILQRHGWEEGWAVLRRVFANARYFTSSSSKVPVDVSAGEAAAGMCIDFYGRYQAGAVADRMGVSRLGYIDPVGMTATTADPISILRGAPHVDLANDFVVWLLSPAAQRLWQRKVGTDGGPERFELRRQPIRADLYRPIEKSYWADPQIAPFTEARPLPPGMPNFYSLVAPVSHAIAIDVHAEVKEAWRVLNQTPADHPRRAEMQRLFDALPPELTIPWPDDELRDSWVDILQSPDHPRRDEVVATLERFMNGLEERWADDDAKLRDRLSWTRFFKRNYERVVELGETRGQPRG